MLYVVITLCALMIWAYVYIICLCHSVTDLEKQNEKLRTDVVQLQKDLYETNVTINRIIKRK